MNFRLAVLAAILFMLAMIPARAAEGERVILVLDASGSMWGQIDSKTKMEIAKEVVGKVVGKWKPEDELGLVAYGHREKGSCSDIEVLHEAGTLDAAGFMAMVNGLNPKGKTPMTAAVRMAAESLKFTEKKATVILVSDGIETCDPNPCAVAEELEKLGVALTVHTVGFGLDDQGAVAQLKCLAEKTGGTATTADNADELEDALTKTVDAKTEEPPPEPAVVDEFNVRGHVMMAEGVELPVKHDQPAWEIYAAVNGEKGERITTEYGVDLKYALTKPGDYIVRVSEDVAAIEFPIKLVEGIPHKLDVSLEAGLVKLTGYMDDATAMTDDGAAWELLELSGNRITTKYGKETNFLANAGSYKVALALGEARVEQEIKVAAGKIVDMKMSLGAGVIQVSGFFTAGGQAVPDGATVELRKGEANLDGQHERITTAYGTVVKFNAPAGNYQVYVKQDYAEALVDTKATAGGFTKLDVVLNAGYLALTGPAGSAIEIHTSTKDLAGNRERIGTDYDAINKAFNAGTYHVVLKGSDGTVIGEKDVEIKAGARSEITIP